MPTSPAVGDLIWIPAGTSIGYLDKVGWARAKTREPTTGLVVGQGLERHTLHVLRFDERIFVNIKDVRRL